jgi:heme/copper-type cytochrome/quinol oxidase subunit 2
MKSYVGVFFLLTLISMILAIGLTSYIIIITHRHKKRITCMAGMMIAMTVGMMSSLLMGTVLGTMTNGKLVMPTIYAIVVGMVVGFCTGRPISLMAALDGLLAGIMGGMMGAMLGVMVFSQSSTLMILFVDVVFVIVVYILLRLIKEEAGISQRETVQMDRKVFLGRLKFILPIAFILFIIAFKIYDEKTSYYTVSTPANTSTDQEVIAQQGNGYQEAIITVEQYGYTPETIKVKKGIPVKLRFLKNYPGGCLSYLIMKDFGIQQELKQGETTVNFTPTQAGTYTFTCGMGMFSGTITVES